MSIEILTLPPEQWQQYRQIRLEALQTDPQAFGASYADNLTRPDAYWRERLAEAARGEQSWLLFARAEGRIIGMMGAYRTGEDEVHVIAVYVSPQWRGRGVSTALMTRLLEEIARDPAIRTATLGVTKGQDAALALYRRFGFEITGEKSVEMGDGQIHDQILMARAVEAQ